VEQDPVMPAYPHGTVVELLAEPATGFTFVGWGGDAKGNDPYVQLVMDGPKTATAIFVATTYTLDVSASGAGTVVKQPDQASYPAGYEVQLIASPADTAHHFQGWSGDADGRSTSTSVVRRHNSLATANFVSNRYPVNITVIGGGTISRNPNLPDYYM